MLRAKSRLLLFSLLFFSVEIVRSQTAPQVREVTSLPTLCYVGDFYHRTTDDVYWLCNTGGKSYSRVSPATIAGGNGDPSGYTTVVYSATPTFTVTKNTGQSFLITLTGNVTSSTLDTSGITNSGRPILTFKICQDGVGSHTFVWPTTILNAGTIESTASACTNQVFVWDGTNAQALGIPFVTGIPGSAITMVGATSGSVTLGAQAIAGTAHRVNLPTAKGTAGQGLLTDGGTPENLYYGPVGSVPSLSLYANIGACTTTPYFKLITSGIFYAAHCGGASDLSILWNGRVVTPAAGLTLTSHLQAGVSVSSANGYEAMTTPANGSTTLSYRTWAVPAAPYNKFVVAIPPIIADSNANYQLWSVGFADGTGAQLGLVCGVGVAVSAGYWCRVDVMSSGTYSSSVVAFFTPTYWTPGAYAPNPIIVMGDDTTNIGIGVSFDGVSFNTLFSEGRTTHFAAGPTQFYYGAFNSSANAPGNMILVGIY